MKILFTSSGIPRSGRSGLFGEGLGPATFRRRAITEVA
jgi:hypothetical protein